ncbi:unnamed protein product [Caenorhabditis bovis]|uniref:ABC transporter domain-containing protein n=1 Tax=Caenorhabditis bovis TaxID=2654633 RepID=A0A8S1ETV8_9PELO|nr:unnamed protein product [Caenorhabditis bovis]
MIFDDAKSSLIFADHSNSYADGCNLYWSSLNVIGPETTSSNIVNRLKTPIKARKILHNVSGMAESGKLLAIMGSSGAGKTTLLNVLTSRNLDNLDVQGTILLDGKRTNKWKMREISAFVQQHDVFVGTLTAREHLNFMARLRMGPQFSKCDRELRVETVINQMGLQKCADTIIGIPNQLKGLSCGEKKRLAFASEILTCPKILFCDEPTSGLDAFMAATVVQALRRLADEGMTVIITIHQPSSQIYSLFHNVCLMACGRIIYLGPGDQAVSLFENCGYPCPPFYNPADHLIRTLAVIDNDRATSLQTIAKIRNGFYRSDLGKEMLAIGQAQVNESARSDSFGSERTAAFFAQEYKTSFYNQFCALLWRSWITVIRDPNLLSVRLFQVVITALITGIVYFQTPITSATIISLNGILFNHIRSLNFMLQFPNVPVITAELPIVLRENANGIYKTSAYFVAKNVAELPQYIILPVLFNCIVYWMSGLYPNFSNFCFASFIAILITNVAISVSYAVATIFANTDVAMTILPIFVVPVMAFGGFFISLSTIPPYFIWLRDLSYFKYGYEALAINQWESVHVIPDCFNSTISCPKSGQEVLEQIDFAAGNKIEDAIILFLMFILIRIVAFIALMLRSFSSQ